MKVIENRSLFSYTVVDSAASLHVFLCECILGRKGEERKENEPLASGWGTFSSVKCYCSRACALKHAHLCGVVCHRYSSCESAQ